LPPQVAVTGFAVFAVVVYIAEKLNENKIGVVALGRRSQNGEWKRNKCASLIHYSFRFFAALFIIHLRF